MKRFWFNGNINVKFLLLRVIISALESLFSKVATRALLHFVILIPHTGVQRAGMLQGR